MSNPNDNTDPDKMSNLQFALKYGIMATHNAKVLIDNHALMLQRIHEFDAHLLETFKNDISLNAKFEIWLDQMNKLQTPQRLIANIAEAQSIIKKLSDSLLNAEIGQATFDVFFFDMNKVTQELRDICYAEMRSVIEVVEFDFGVIIEDGVEIDAVFPQIIEIGNTAVDSAWRTLAYADLEMYE